MSDPGARLHVVSGKGGTGKTTVAAALALALATEGKRTLLVEVEGRRHPLTKSRTVIGRGSDADITIADAGTSRKHIEILWDGERGMLRDLGSTNGTKVDGQKIRETALTPGTSFTIGRTELTFQVVPVSPSTGSETHPGSGTQRGTSR